MIFQNFDLTEHNTFNLRCTAKTCLIVQDKEDLQSLSQKELSSNYFVLGGGSNVVFKNSYYDGLIIKMENKGINIISENEKEVVVEALAGENWNDFVHYCADRNWWGTENLVMIYGNIGAVAVQNIGAYGVELKDVFLSCQSYNPKTKTWTSYSKEDCGFDYRQSVFKNERKGEIIWSVRLILKKETSINSSYKAIKEEISKLKEPITTPLEMINLIKSIRQSKLPEPEVLPNAGSFFKNPIISKTQYESLIQLYPQMPVFLANSGVKVSAAWLIQDCGFKGRRVGNVGMHEKQALVMVNYSNATAQEIISLTQEIISSVEKRFQIVLEPEVNIV